MTPADLRTFCLVVIAAEQAFKSTAPTREILSLHARAVKYAEQGLAEVAEAAQVASAAERGGRG